MEHSEGTEAKLAYFALLTLLRADTRSTNPHEVCVRENRVVMNDKGRRHAKLGHDWRKGLNVFLRFYRDFIDKERELRSVRISCVRQKFRDKLLLGILSQVLANCRHGFFSHIHTRNLEINVFQAKSPEIELPCERFVDQAMGYEVTFRWDQVGSFPNVVEINSRKGPQYVRSIRY